MGRAQEDWGVGVWPEGGSLARRQRPGMRGKERRGGRCRRHQRREATQPSAQAAASLRVAPGPGVSFGGAPPRAPGTESSRLRGSVPAQGATRREPSPGQTPRCEARRGGRCGAIVDEPQQSRWPPIPCALGSIRGWNGAATEAGRDAWRGSERRPMRCHRMSETDKARRPASPVPSGAGGGLRMAVLASLERAPPFRRSAALPCSPGAARATPWPFADRPLGCRGTAPPAVLSLLDDVQRHRRRRDALHPGPWRWQRDLREFFSSLLSLP